MTSKDFEIFCSRKAPEHLKPYIPKAIRAAEVFRIDFVPGNAPSIIFLAREFYEEFKNMGVKKPPEALLELSPEGLIQSDMLLKEILPSLLKIRQSYFGTTSPPFPDDIGRAIQWLDVETQKHVVVLKEKASPSAILRLRKLIYQTIPQYIRRKQKQMPGHAIKLAIEVLFFEFRDINGKKIKRQIILNSPLHLLKKYLKTLSNDTGFSFEMLLIFLLTGIPPALPVFRINTSIKLTKTVNVDFLRSLSYGEMLELHKLLRSALSAGTKVLSEKSLELYQLVKAKGGVPIKGKKAFWTQVCQEWNDTHPGDKFKSYESIKATYGRIIRTQKRRIQEMRAKT